MSEQAFKLTKLDAARRQLHVALEMWFSEADPIAAHTLINAAHRNSGGLRLACVPRRLDGFRPDSCGLPTLVLDSSQCDEPA